MAGIFEKIRPSNVNQEQEAKGFRAIGAQKRACTQIFGSGEVKNSWRHLLITRPVRLLTRLVYTQAVGLLIAPVGILYHGTNTVAFLVRRYKQTDQGKVAELSRKIDVHTKELILDCTCFLSSVLTLASLYSWHYCAARGTKFRDYLGFLGPFAKLGEMPLAWAQVGSIALSTYFLFRPDQVLNLASSARPDVDTIAMQLYSDLGLCDATTGGPLPLDQGDLLGIERQFKALLEEVPQIFINQINSINKKLEKEKLTGADLFDTHWNLPFWESLGKGFDQDNYCEPKFDEIIKKLENHPGDFNSEILDLKKFRRQVIVLKKIYGQLLYRPTLHTLEYPISLTSTDNYPQEMKPWANVQKAYFEHVFTSQDSEEINLTLFQKSLEAHTKDLRNCSFEAFPPEYRGHIFRMLMASSREEFFGVARGAEKKEERNAYRKLQRLFHSDKASRLGESGEELTPTLDKLTAMINAARSQSLS